MRPSFREVCILVLAINLLSACGDRREPDTAHDIVNGDPVYGGTLKMVGYGDVDHLASTSAYVSSASFLIRTFARQLVAYQAADDYHDSAALKPDIALEIPTMENGGLSADGRTYVFHLKPGVRWNSSPPRAVVAGDFVRALKLFCNPVNPVGAPGYYTSTIKGMAEYCSLFAKVPGTVGDIREFIDSHDIAGVHAPDDATLVIELTSPAADFLNLLAMTFASAVPIEYLDYLPDSPEFRQHTLSNGPYAITRYMQNRFIEFERNPVWDRNSDPLNPAYVDRMQVTLGIDPELGQLQIEAGTADLDYESTMLTANQAILLGLSDNRVSLFPPGDHFSNIHYLAVNIASPNNSSALANLQVRQALALAVNKRALVQLVGGKIIARPLNQAVTSAVSGFREGADQYVTADNQGDPVAARKLLAEAGFGDGLTLRLAFPRSSNFPIEAQAIQASLKRAGFDVQLFAYPTSDFWGRLLPNSQNAKRGEWDIALSGWLPDWYGDNNGRSVVSPLFDGRQLGHISQNFGLYSNPLTNAAIDRALAADSVVNAEIGWFEATSQVMKDVAIVPLIEKKSGYMRSARLRNCLWAAVGDNCNLSGVWLADAVPPAEEPAP